MSLYARWSIPHVMCVFMWEILYPTNVPRNIVKVCCTLAVIDASNTHIYSYILTYTPLEAHTLTYIHIHSHIETHTLMYTHIQLEYAFVFVQVLCCANLLSNSYNYSAKLTGNKAA